MAEAFGNPSRTASIFFVSMFSSCQCYFQTKRCLINILTRCYSIITPLIFSAIFYAVNGETHVPYIDALFLCVSATTVCGLATVELSRLTAFQQVLLFIQACIGNPVISSCLFTMPHSGLTFFLLLIYIKRWLYHG